MRNFPKLCDLAGYYVNVTSFPAAKETSVESFISRQYDISDDK